MEHPRQCKRRAADRCGDAASLCHDRVVSDEHDLDTMQHDARQVVERVIWAWGVKGDSCSLLTDRITRRPQRRWISHREARGPLAPNARSSLTAQAAWPAQNNRQRRGIGSQAIRCSFCSRQRSPNATSHAPDPVAMTAQTMLFRFTREPEIPIIAPHTAHARVCDGAAGEAATQTARLVITVKATGRGAQPLEAGPIHRN